MSLLENLVGFPSLSLFALRGPSCSLTLLFSLFFLPVQAGLLPWTTGSSTVASAIGMKLGDVRHHVIYGGVRRVNTIHNTAHFHVIEHTSDVFWVSPLSVETSAGASWTLSSSGAFSENFPGTLVRF